MFGAPFAFGDLIVTQLGDGSNFSNTPTNTISGLSLGILAATGGTVAIAMASEANLNTGIGANFSLTVNGVAATQIKFQEGNALTFDTTASVWLVDIPAAANATVVIHNSAGNLGASGVTLYAMQGLASHTAVDTKGQSSSSNNLSQNIDVHGGGAVIGASMVNGVNPSPTWTGLSLGSFHPQNPLPDTEASASNLAAQTLTAAVSWTGGLRGWVMALASFA